jgi:hypothetical protein
MKSKTVISVVTAFITASFLSIGTALAHCDTLDGPVVLTAKLALEKGDVIPVLKWVKPDDEKEIRDAFAKAVKVRGLGDDARALADLHFFETLVRLHRAGEGVAYTGRKPAGAIDPGIDAADKALEHGSADALARGTAKAIEKGILKRFADVAEKKKRAEESVEAGRAYVAAYVGYVHYVEALAALAAADPEAHHHIHAAEPAH